MSIANSQGKIFYGMHFYPGVAEYQEPGKDPYRIYLNEDTLRSMDPSFAGRPIFVEHVDEVDDDLDELRKEADGWVIESFFNSADGKHWVKFIVVSEIAEQAIKNGLRLSNAYIPKSFANGGLWNGVSYIKEITGGEYEHLAIVKNPRYEESVILSPEQFKKYNEDKVIELKKLSNSKDDKGETKMKLNFFKKTKVENSDGLEGMSVVLPKSKQEMTVEQLVNEMDTIKNMDGYASPDHVVKIHDGSEMKVSELVEKHKAMHDELESMKAKKDDELEDETGLETDEEPVDSESVKHEKKDEMESKKEDAEDGDKAKIVEEKDKEIEAAKKKNAKEKAERLKNAHLKEGTEEIAKVEFSADQVARGRSRYGSV